MSLKGVRLKYVIFVTSQFLESISKLLKRLDLNEKLKRPPLGNFVTKWSEKVI